jgi:copper transport protein
MIRRAVALAGLVVALVCLAPPRPAGAHALLVRSQPANGATVAVTPDVVRLWFSEEISTEVSTARLVDRSGATVAGTRVLAEAGVLEMRVPPLARGTYGVFWRVLAEDDGHTSSGTVVFSVGASNGALAPGPAGSGSSGTGLDAARRWLGLCALAGVLGGLAVAGLVLGRMTAPGVDVVRRGILAGVIGCAVLSAAVRVVDAVVQARRLAPSGRGWVATLGDLLASSRWGHLWLAGEATLLILIPVVVALRARNKPGPALLAASLALVLVSVEALGSHAATAGSPRTVSIVSDAAHVLAACVWLGALPALAVLLSPPQRRDLLRACREPFTVLLAGSVLLVVVTGLYNAGRQVDTVGELVSTSYGRLLLIKTALLAVVLALGLDSARRWQTGRAPVRRIVVAEAATGAALLIAVAVLVDTPPARGGTGDAAGRSHSGSVADLVVTVSAAPNLPGTNGITVQVVSSRRPPPAPVSAVTVQGARLAPVGPDRFFGTVELTHYGAAPLTTVLQRGGEQLTLTVPWRVEATWRHGTRLAPYVDAIAVVLLACATLAAAAFARARRRKPAKTLIS